MSVQYGSSFDFDGVLTTDYGVWISGVKTYAAPERDVETVAVPGRNGLLTLDNGRYQNIRITYPCFMADNFATDFQAFKSEMLSRVGYFDLEDTYHPEGYRKARIVGGFNPETGILNRSAKFDVQFDCYPQFFLNSGEIYQNFTEDGTLNNPTPFPSKPLIRVVFSGTPRSGTLTVNGETITIDSAAMATLYIDCESQYAFFIINGVHRALANQYITLTTGDFPTLSPENNGVAKTGNISTVGIMPRWYLL